MGARRIFQFQHPGRSFWRWGSLCFLPERSPGFDQASFVVLVDAVGNSLRQPNWGVSSEVVGPPQVLDFPTDKIEFFLLPSPVAAPIHATKSQQLPPRCKRSERLQGSGRRTAARAISKRCRQQIDAESAARQEPEAARSRRQYLFAPGGR
jgi:hypothetical protein